MTANDSSSEPDTGRGTPETGVPPARAGEREGLYRQMFERHPAVKLLIDPSSGEIVDANAAAARFYGYPQELLCGMNIARLNALPMEQLAEVLQRALTGECNYFVFPHRLASGQERMVEVHTGPLEIGGRALLHSIVHDITERHQLEDRLRYEVEHDALTELPNRRAFMARLERMAERARIGGDEHFAVLYLDLDRFKTTNDQLGHAAGDRVLREVSERLRAGVRPTDIVARLGGDEFAVLLPYVADQKTAFRVADRVRQVLAPPIFLDEREVLLSASIGVALSSAGFRSGEDLLRDADAAMYRAKEIGPGQQVLFDAEMRVHLLAVTQLELELRHAAERDEFSVLYQPIVSFADRRITGFEALVRWRHPSRGLVGPQAFIPILEQAGTIATLDLWVLRTACAQLRRWLDAGTVPPGTTMSVNLSGQGFARTQLVSDVEEVLAETGLEPQSLQLEITETAVMANVRLAADLLNRLRAKGLRFAIDDFGTGFSSLNYLQLFRVDALKVDRGFVRQMDKEGNSSRAIVRTVIALAHALGLEVIAEGIERPSQLVALRVMGCERGQGFLFSPPRAPEPVERWLRDGGPPTWMVEGERPAP